MKKVLVCVLLGVLVPVFAFGSEVLESGLSSEGQEVEKASAPEKKGESLKKAAKVGLGILGIGFSIVSPVAPSFFKEPAKTGVTIGLFGYDLYINEERKKMQGRGKVRSPQPEINEVTNDQTTGF